MTLNEALQICNLPRSGDGERRLFLVCGFQPLHLATFLRARLRQRFPDSSCDILTGLYGDFAGNCGKAAASDATGAAVAVEWSDIDPRLGLRSGAAWSAQSHADIVSSCAGAFDRLAGLIAQIAAKMPVAVSGPTLARMPLGYTASGQISEFELALDQQLAQFLLRLAGIAGVRIVDSRGLDAASPVGERLDAKMELLAGFPYRNSHTDALAAALIGVLYPAAPRKGLITDLDDTLWHGIVGEIGADAISWSQAHHSQIHGLYQQALGRLADMGVLLAVASKNEPAVVEEAFRRPDLLVKADHFFPIVAGWNAKSQSVAEILKAWNIAADSVVMVDDSPMELDQIKSAHPGIETLQFPKQAGAAVELIEKLRSLFGKPELFAEDRLRLASIRANAEFQHVGSEKAGLEFLAQLNGKVIFDSRKDPTNKRLLELINKTNQFNLNGARIAEGEWLQRLAEPDVVCLAVSYEDKFGSLGTIGVLTGRMKEAAVDVDHWVMSCRAFSRRIEHRTLEFLFQHTGAERVNLNFRVTERNQPLQEFLREASFEGNTISRESFLGAALDLPHEVVWEKS